MITIPTLAAMIASNPDDTVYELTYRTNAYPGSWSMGGTVRIEGRDVLLTVRNDDNTITVHSFREDDILKLTRWDARDQV